MRATTLFGAAVAAVLAVAACGGPAEKLPEAEPASPLSAAAQDSIAQDSIAKASAKADSAKCAGADSVKCVAAVDSATRAAKAKAVDTRLRDSAFGPKYTVDSTGKVTPIKPKPPAKKP